MDLCSHLLKIDIFAVCSTLTLWFVLDLFLYLRSFGVSWELVRLRFSLERRSSATSKVASLLFRIHTSVHSELDSHWRRKRGEADTYRLRKKGRKLPTTFLSNNVHQQLLKLPISFFLSTPVYKAVVQLYRQGSSCWRRKRGQARTHTE